MRNLIAKTALIYPNVFIGNNVIVEDYCIIGCPSKHRNSNQEETIIGDNSIIRSHTVIYSGNKIGRNFQTGNKANIRELNEIGDDVSVGTLSIVEHHVKIGNGVRIHSQVFIPEYTILDSECWLGPNVVITNAKYPRSINVKANLKGAHIKSRAIIGANATLLPDVIIGEQALIGAGSVVTKNVEAKTVVVGNPAQKIKSIQELPYNF